MERATTNDAGHPARHPRIGAMRRGARPMARTVGTVAAAVALVLASTSCLLVDYATGARDGCTEYMRTVEFETSNDVLRGVWQGVAHDYPAPGTDTDLTLDLAATFVDEGSYAVAGTFVLGAEDPMALAGAVDGGCTERYVLGAAPADGPPLVGDGDLVPAEAPPPALFLADVRDVDDVLRWTVRSDWGAAYGGERPATDQLLIGLGSAFDLGEEGPYGRIVEMARAAAP